MNRYSIAALVVVAAFSAISASGGPGKGWATIPAALIAAPVRATPPTPRAAPHLVAGHAPRTVQDRPTALR